MYQLPCQHQHRSINSDGTATVKLCPELSLRKLRNDPERDVPFDALQHDGRRLPAVEKNFEFRGFFEVVFMSFS